MKKASVLKENVAQAISNTIDVSSSEIYGYLSYVPEITKGHITLPCFQLNVASDKTPYQISLDVAAKLKSDKRLEEKVASIQSFGPYLNLFLQPSYLAKEICEPILSGDFFKHDLIEHPQKTMIEYSQPNTHKLIHVGHCRNLALGSALINIHKYCGVPVVATTFPGDVGTHIAKSLWYLYYHCEEAIPTTNKGEWLGQLYVKATNLYEVGNAEQKIKNKDQVSKILSQIESKEGHFYDLWLQTRQWSIELMEEVYDWAGIQFDKWYWESELDSASIQTAHEYLEKGIFSKSRGTIGIDLSAFDMGFCLLVKADGNGLYAAKDVELTGVKFEDFDIEKSIYVVDQRQAYHFKQVFKTCELMGLEQAKDCYHLAYNYVELPDGAMASRKGNVIPLQQLISDMETLLKEQGLADRKSSWSEQKINDTAKDMVKGAIKYGMLKVDPDKKIVFDLPKWLDVKGNSGVYLQYTYARINSLKQKLDYNFKRKVDWNLLSSDMESAMLIHLSKFNEILLKATEQYKPNLVCNYLYELCRQFNRYYNYVSFKDSPENVKHTRLRFVDAISILLSQGFELLGIPVLEEM